MLNREHIKTSPVSETSRAAVRAFFNITKLWKLTSQEQIILLGSPPRSTFFKWKKDEKISLPHDTLERISYILGIYKALQILLPRPEIADSWIKKPNLALTFQGKPALNRMLSGHVSDLYVVRQYLDAQCVEKKTITSRSLLC